jgi:phospholipid/cholesterol/gamma-HCH transport system permease protein
MRAFFQHAGRFLAWLLAYGAAYVGLFLDAASHAGQLLREPSRRLLLKQLYFTGIETLPLLTVVALVTGYASTTALYGVLLQDMGLTLDVFRALVIREASILLVAFYVLARSGSAIASELASMRQNGELATLYSLGIDPAAYLIAPRITALILSVTALSIYFQVTAVYGGFALMSIFSNWDYMLAIGKFNDGLEAGALVLIVAKTLVFGGIIGTVCCQQGLAAVPGPLGIPGATRTALIHSFTAIVLGNGVFVALFG